MNKQVVLIFIAAALLRMILLFVFPGITAENRIDYARQAEVFRRGGNVYTEGSFYNYSPVWGFTVAALPDAQRDSGFFIAICDLIAGALIYRITRRPLAAALYLFNPVVVANGGFVAQFEPYALIPLLLAILDENPKRSWLWATLSILVKQNMLFLAWCVIVYRFPPRKAILALVASGTIFALTLLPYAISGGIQGILNNVVAYQGSLLSVYGLSVALPPRFVTLIALIVLLPLPFFLRARRVPFYTALSTVGFGLCALLPGYGPNYFIPCIAILAIADNQWLRLLSVFMLGISLSYFIQPETVVFAFIRNVSQIALWVMFTVAFGLALIRLRRGVRITKVVTKSSTG